MSQDYYSHTNANSWGKKNKAQRKNHLQLNEGSKNKHLNEGPKSKHLNEGPKNKQGLRTSKNK